MNDTNTDQNDPQSEGSGMEKEAQRRRDAGEGMPDPKEAAREASRSDDKAS